MAKAVIFDFDGVIANTEPLHLESYNRALRELGKSPISKNDFKNYTGKSPLDIWNSIKGEIQLDTEDLISFKERFYYEIIDTSDIKPAPDLIDLLNELKKFGWKLAIASSSSEETLRVILNKIKIFEYFDIIITNEKIKNSKPSPDIYTLTISKLSIEKERVVVIEDSENGLNSAKKAGLKCIVIPNEFTNLQDFSQSDIKIHNLKNLSHRKLIGLIKRRVVYIPKSITGYCGIIQNALENSILSQNGTLEIVYPDKDENLNSQIGILNKLLDDPPDDIIIVPVDNKISLKGPLKSLMKKGVNVVSLDVELDFDEYWDAYRGCISIDFYEGGRIAAETLVKILKGEGKIAVITGPKNHRPSEERLAGFIRYISEYVPKIQFMSLYFTNWGKHEGFEIANNFINEGIELDGIFCACDNLAIGVATAYDEANNKNNFSSELPKIIGFDGILDVYKYILDDKIIATIDFDIYIQGIRAVHRLLNYDSPEEYSRVPKVIPKVLTKSEIKRERRRVKCFISYSHSDKEIVSKIESKLSLEGYTVVIDEEYIIAGDEFINKLRNNIPTNDIFILILSENSINSKFVSDEINSAIFAQIDGKLRIIPILISDCKIPKVIERFAYLDFRDRKKIDMALKQLIITIERVRRLI